MSAVELRDSISPVFTKLHLCLSTNSSALSIVSNRDSQEHVYEEKSTLLKGVVTNAKKSGYFGRGGELNVRVESTETIDKQKLKVRAAKGREGDNKTGTTVALVVLFGPLGFLKKGKNAEIKEGTKIKVYTDEVKTVQIPRP